MEPILGAGAAVAAFDIGGTDTKAALIDSTGKAHSILRHPTLHQGEDTAQAVLTDVASIMRRFAAEHPAIVPRAVGLVIPGVVDDVNGIGLASENLGWRNVPFKELANRLLQLPVFVGHDVRAAGEAERRLGAAREYNDVIVIVIGTGISGAIFINGQPYLGGGYAGEIGHSIVDPVGPLCACSAHGCLEAIASAGAIARTYTALSGEEVAGAKQVLARAEAGDRIAQGVWERALDVLALELARTVSLLAPEAIVIGGGLAQAGEALFGPLRRRLDALLTFQRRPVLRPAMIGENAGLVGAALRARDLVSGLPSQS